MTIAYKYSLFALLATLLNLGAQEASFRVYDGAFSIYPAMALGTAIFWGFEIGFDWLIGGRVARYAGAVIGLSIGYGVKYRLDKRYVFSQQDI